MSSTAWMLWGCAAAGVAANVWLSRHEPGRKTPAMTSRAVIADCQGAHARGPGVVGACERELLACTELSDGCRGFVAACNEEVSASAGLGQRFSAAARSQVAEARLTPLLDRALGEVEGVEWVLECRGAVCRIALDGETDEAAAVLQTELHHIIVQASFASEPSDQPERPELIAFLELHERDRVPAIPVLIDLQDRFEASGALLECAPESGTFNVRVDLPVDQDVIVHYGGSVTGTAAGRCLLNAFDRELARTVIPPHRTGATRFLRYRSPWILE
jgi:hypothetical protein